MTSRVLVLAQVVLACGLLWPGSVFAWRVEGVGLAVTGAVLGLWAMTANRPGNFSVMPEPKLGARLIQSGPYRWVRHPMYTAVMLVTLGSTLCQCTGLHLLAWVGLVAVLHAKASREERLLRAVYPEYAAYYEHTGRFLPFR